MSRWLPSDLMHTSLDAINAEIAEILALPSGQQSVSSTERLRDLLDARNRITGGRGCGWTPRGTRLGVVDRRGNFRGNARPDWCLIAGGLRSRGA